MASFDTQNQGYPRSNVKRDWQHIRYCGGSGSGACAEQLSQTMCFFAVWVNPYITRIRNLVLNNPELNGVRIYTDAGVSGLCSHSKGSEVPWHLGFHTNDLLTYDEVVAQGNQLSGEQPFDIEVAGTKLPQPTDAGWDGILWVYIAWGSTSYVADQDLTNYTQWLRPAKIDFDVRQ